MARGLKRELQWVTGVTKDCRAKSSGILSHLTEGNGLAEFARWRLRTILSQYKEHRDPNKAGKCDDSQVADFQVTHLMPTVGQTVLEPARSCAQQALSSQQSGFEP